MNARRAHRITRLEEAATTQMVLSLARRYALTNDETTELMRETQHALRRWRAGLSIDAPDDVNEGSDADATL